MLLSDYSNRSFSLGDVQFALGIVLSNLGENDAAKQVISFLGTNKPEPGKSVDEIIEFRATLDDALHHVDVNIINAFITYLCNKKVFNSSGYSQIHGMRSKCTLRDLLDHTNISVLYDEVMKLLFRVESNMLLYHYMFTPLFMENFKVTILQMVRKSKSSARVYRRGGLSDSDFSAILNDFSKTIRANSCNGSYSVDTGDPDAFLCSAPLRKWYPATPGNEYIKILHGQGQDSMLSETGDGTTVLDLKGITDKTSHVSIDFSLVCAEIAEASKLLFTHNGSDIAFYDIFSFHRERKINVKKKGLQKLNNVLKGILFDVVEDTLDDNSGDSESIRNKYCGRRVLCEILENAFEHGVAATDLYPLYKQLLKATSRLHTKNAQRLFRVGDQKTKQVYTNGQIFHILVNGYHSLFNLLAYLNSSDNTTSITEDSFPARIFRDKQCLKRFRTLEDYEKTGDIIFQLMDEISASPERKLPESDGFLSNDRVFDILCDGSFSFDSVLGTLGAKPISFIALAVNEVYSSNQDSLILLKLDNIRTKLKTHGFEKSFLTGEYKTLSYAQSLKQLSHFSDVVREVYNQKVLQHNEKILNFYTYHSLISYVKLLLHVMELEGTPVVDKNDVFDVSGNVVSEIFMPVENLAQKYLHQIKYTSDLEQQQRFKNGYAQLHESYLKRILCCCFIYELFTGVGGWKEKGYRLNRVEFHDLLCITDILFAYLKGIGNMLGDMPMVTDGNDMYLALVSLVRSNQLLCMPDCVTDIQSVSFLYESGCSAYLYKDLLSDIDKLKSASKRSNLVILSSLNRFFKTISPVKNIFNRTQDLITSKIKINNFESVHQDYDVEDLLQSENETLIGITNTSDDVRLIRDRLRILIGSFDRNNYACLGSRLLTLKVSSSNNSLVYLHKNGYATTIDKFNHLASSRSMTNKDLEMVRNVLIFNG